MSGAAAGVIELVTFRNVRFAIGRADQLALLQHDGDPQTTRATVAELHGTLRAAVPGPMFRFADGEQHRTYEAFTHGTERYAHYYPARGIQSAGENPHDGVSIFVANGVAGGEPGAGTRRPGETFRIQGYPSLMLAGVKTTGLRDVDAVARPCVGVLTDGRVFVAIGTSISMPDLATAMEQANFGTAEAPVRVVWAGYLDGGGSGAYWVDIEGDGNPESTFALDGRRIVSWVTLEQPPAGIAGVAAAAVGEVRAALLNPVAAAQTALMNPLTAVLVIAGAVFLCGVIVYAWTVGRTKEA